jgi:hypothetical protein
VTAARGFVLDASVWINILGTGCPERILRCLGAPAIVVDTAAGEVVRNPLDARSTDPLLPLVQSKLIERATLDAEGAALFVSLVGAESPDDLGDGEAATLAYASRTQLSAAIDERKGRRIAGERFPELPLRSTVDLLRSTNVVSALGGDLPDAVHGALVSARMRVVASDAPWVVQCIGLDRARECAALRRWVPR